MQRDCRRYLTSYSPRAISSYLVRTRSAASSRSPVLPSCVANSRPPLWPECKIRQKIRPRREQTAIQNEARTRIPTGGNWRHRSQSRQYPDRATGEGGSFAELAAFAASGRLGLSMARPSLPRRWDIRHAIPTRLPAPSLKPQSMRPGHALIACFQQGSKRPARDLRFVEGQFHSGSQHSSKCVPLA